MNKKKRLCSGVTVLMVLWSVVVLSACKNDADSPPPNEPEDTALFALNLAQVPNGKLELLSPANVKTVAEGTTITIRTIPQNGYIARSAQIQDKPTIEVKLKAANQWTFVMPAFDVTVTAVFTEPPPLRTIQIAEVSNGMVAIVQPADGKAAEGTEVSLYTTPAVGYRAEAVRIAGRTDITVTQTPGQSKTREWKFTMPDADVTVNADFIATPTLTVNNGTGWLNLRNIDDTFTLTAGGSAANAGTKWESSDAGVVELSAAQGASITLTAKALGQTTISALSADGSLRASLIVAVTGKEIKGETVAVDSSIGAAFFTDQYKKLAYALTSGGIEIQANPSGSKWLLTAYLDNGRKTRGWYYSLNGAGPVQSEVSTWRSPTAGPGSMLNGFQIDTKNGVTLELEPYMMYVDNVPYILIVHRLTNTSDKTVNDYTFGACSDVQLGSNDSAPLVFDNGNIKMSGKDAGTDYRIELVCKSGEFVTPVSTAWIGKTSTAASGHKATGDGTHFWENIYTDGTGTGYTGSGDSAFAFSYKSITLLPGEAKTFLVRFTLVPVS